MDAIQERTEHLKEEAYKYSRDVHSKVDSLLKDAMLENMVNEFRDLSARMTGPERQMFDGTLVQSIAEQGKEVMHCATLLFLGMVDDATTFAETHGGGGSKSDLKWGRDEDEDNRAWALRCMRMASRMMKPQSAGSPSVDRHPCPINQKNQPIKVSDYDETYHFILCGTLFAAQLRECRIVGQRYCPI